MGHIITNTEFDMALFVSPSETFVDSNAFT